MAVERQRYEIGFTLAETLIMICIIGFLSIVVSFSIRYLFPFRVQAAARRLVSDIVFTKKLAETTNVKCGVIFYPVQEKYTVYTSTFSTPATDPLNRKPMMRDFTAGDFRNVNLVSASFGGNTYIEFDPLGRNFTGGSVVFTYDSESYTVWVEDNTGRTYWTKP